MGRAKKKRSRETRRAISEGKKARALRDFENRGPDPSHKRCSKCRKVKPVAEFYQRRAKRKSGFIYVYPEASCKECFRAQAKKTRETRKRGGHDEYERWKRWWANASPEQKARTREHDRERQATYRRKKGHAALGARRPQKPNAGERVAVEPIAAFLEREIEGRRINGQTAQGVIAEQTGVAQRRIYGILRRQEAQVSLRLVDKLLTGLGCPHELHLLYPLD